MKYNSMTELNAAYGGDKMDRGSMSLEEELRYVQDCFDTFEGIGFRRAFRSPYEEQERNNGKEFTVVRRLSYANGDADLECLPMWHIRFADGDEIDAYPEEICEEEHT